MRENFRVQARFLLGPAGSGKTFRCLAEVRTALASHPDGEPLVFLAPKQATFQIERQLLDGGEISGYTRLHILSFDRLAQFIFDRLQVAPPKLLSAEGRLMVLRALLLRHAGELKLFRGSGRRAGFAQELGGLLAELQQHQLGPAKLRALAADEKLRRELRDKLHDLALLAEKYADWLREHGLQDANNLLDVATIALREARRTPHSALRISALWLDGFAEMTPQELALLTAVMPFCESATLAFCLETEPTKTESWLSIWSAIGKTFQRCRDQIRALPDGQVLTEVLPRKPGQSRFAENSELGELEAGWSLPVGSPSTINHGLSTISLTTCANPEAEATFAAREILKFVRAGNRFRDCAVLVRQLENYHPVLARVFRRYEIPFFLDRREGVAHHPLAELTRSALRTVAFDWRMEDWFAALKAGFAPLPEPELDRLENAALEFGWHGKNWREPLPDEYFERQRQIIFPPFENFYAALAKINFQPTGAQLAEFLRGLWQDLKVETTLERWTLDEEKSALRAPHSALHSTVWEQMNLWLENLALAFPHEHMDLRDWLPVLEAGLGNLTVGVIPPALDEVLVGAVDRARNPDLKFALVLGVNESVFPAAPAAPVILTNSDRLELDAQNVALSGQQLDQISRERYLGYIACTRARQKLAVTFARQSADGKPLNPSPLVAQLQRIFPALTVEEFPADLDWHAAQHANELAAMLTAAAGVQASACPGSTLKRELQQIPALKLLAEKLAALREPSPTENLSPALAEKIYGSVLKTSVSRLEEFAQCPFKFFVHSGLRANERKVFELDDRERGSFQHEILEKFHHDLTAEKKRWRDLDPAQARARIAAIAAELAPAYRDGLLHTDDRSRFAARMLTAALQDFVETLVTWMRGQYDFDPAKAELGFGLEPTGLPAWEIKLPAGHTLALRGRIDRIDLHRDGERTLAVVMDYKSSARKLDKLLMAHGVQLQLLAYLAALRQWPADFFGAKKIVPAGAFYVNLRGQFEASGSRAEALADTDAVRKLAYQHSGRFDAGYLESLDRTHAGDQFNYQLNKDGSVRSNSAEALPRGELDALLGAVENQLCDLGGKIFSGAAQVDPYRKGAQTPCEFCEYRAACRLDEWTHPWRVLRATKKDETE